MKKTLPLFLLILLGCFTDDVSAQTDKNINSGAYEPDGVWHGVVSSWAQQITKRREWNKYPYINAVMLDESMQWWTPQGQSYQFDWTSIDADVKYLQGLKRKFAIHINYDYPFGFGYSKETQQGAPWIYKQIGDAGAPNDGVGGARPRGKYPAWYWHKGNNWPWKKMYGWLVKEEAWHLRTNFAKDCIYIRGQFNAEDPENVGIEGVNDVEMAGASMEDYAKWCAETFWKAFMTEDKEFWKDHDVSKLSEANRIQVMFKPKNGVEKLMTNYKFGVFLTHGSPDPDQYEHFENFCRDKGLPGADETSGTPDMSNPQQFYAQHWYHLMALHSGFTTVAMRPGQITIPYNAAISNTIKDQFKESLAFVHKYLGYIHHPEKSPGAWIVFRQVIAKGKKPPYVGSNAGNWNFHVTQNGSADEINKNSPGDDNIGDQFYGLYTRKLVNPITLDFNAQLFKTNAQNLQLQITAFSANSPSSFEISYKAKGKPRSVIVNLKNVNTWQTQIIPVPDMEFNHKEDIKIKPVTGQPYLHMIELTQK